MYIKHARPRLKDGNLDVKEGYEILLGKKKKKSLNITRSNPYFNRFYYILKITNVPNKNEQKTKAAIRAKLS